MSLLRCLAVAVASGSALAAVSSCGAAEQITELVVVVDGDLVFPADADRVTVVADDGDGHVLSLPHEGHRLPLVGGVTATRDLPPITFTATAFRGEEVVMKQEVVAEFVPGERREVRLMLCTACRAVTCAEGEACGESGCAAKLLSDLPRWNGGPPERRSCRAPAAVRPDACDAGEASPTRLSPVAAFDESRPTYPHVCNIDAILARDDVPAGLDYAMGEDGIANSLRQLDGVNVAGCIGVDFGVARPLASIEVRARAPRDERTACAPPSCQAVVQPNACARCCSPCVTTPSPDGGANINHCLKGGELIVFAGATRDAYERIGPSEFLATAFRNFRYETGGRSLRYAVVCRGADGPATADVEVDVVEGVPGCP